MDYRDEPLPPEVKDDPYFPLDPGIVRVYCDAERRGSIYTRVKRVDCKHSHLWRITVERFSTFTGVADKERLRVRASGVYQRREAGEFGPILVLPLQPGKKWTAGANTQRPLDMRVDKPVPTAVGFGQVNSCIRVFQSDPDGTLLRTEWYAPDIGLARWVTHCDQREEMYELVYFRDGITGAHRGRCPEEVLDRLTAHDPEAPDEDETTSQPSDAPGPNIGVQRGVRLSDTRARR